jgi:hypothetical protein
MRLFWNALEKIAHTDDPKERARIIEEHYRVVETEFAQIKKLHDLVEKYKQELSKLYDSKWGRAERHQIIGDCLAYALEIRAELTKLNSNHKLLLG